MSAASGSASTRPNFFELLGLDPDAPWNQTEFERIITEKRREWTKQSLQGIGSKTLEARRYLSLIGEINRVMNDPPLRKKEAEEARLRRDKAKASALDEFKEAVRQAKQEGSVQESVVIRWASYYAALFPGGEKEVRAYLAREGVTIKTKAAARPQTDPIRAKAIHDQLQLLGYDSLYTLLKQELGAPFSKTTSLPTLQQAADRLNREQQRQANKTVEVTAKINLSGHAKVIFSSADERERYHETLRQEGLTPLLQRFEKACEAMQAISATQSDRFLSEAQQLGWEQEEAKEHLITLADRRKWPITFSAGEEKQECGSCQRMNRKGARFCNNCKRQLRMNCPNCGQDASLAESVCGQCGFPVGDFYPFQEMLRTFVDANDHLLPSLELEDAQKTLEYLRQAWAPKNPDDLARQIAKLWAEVQSQFDEQKRLLDMVLQLIDKQHFYEAKALLPKLPPGIPGVPNWPKQQQQIKEKTEAASLKVQQAKQPGTSEYEQEKRYWAALQESADCPEAHEGLRQIAPKPPRDLHIDEAGTNVSLTWKPSPSPGVEHVIVRKTLSPPTSVSDGETLDSIAGHQCQDSNPPIGVPLFYAIFAQREGVVSKAGAQSSRAALFIEEATNLNIQMSNTSITLEWQAPPNVHSVTVVRKEGSEPTGPKDGVTLTPPSGQTNSLLDQSVQEGHRYFYKVYCHFLGEQGRLVDSNGSQSKSVIPQGPPNPLKLDLKLNLRPDRISDWLDIFWAQPEKGQVIILKSDDQSLHLQAGDIVPESYLGHYSQVITQGQGQPISDLWLEPGERYYVPAILFQGNAYIGREQRYVYTKQVTNLKAYNLVTSIRLEWTWPDETDEVQIGYDTSGWPQDAQSAPNKVVVTRAEYERLNLHYYDVQPIRGSQQQYYFIVAPVIMPRGKRVVGDGPRISCYLGPKTRVEYWFERRRTGGYKLILQTREAIMLPAMQIMTRLGAWNMTRTDGSHWQLIRPGPARQQRWEIDVAWGAFPNNTYGRLFLEDEAYENSFDLIPINPERLKLS